MRSTVGRRAAAAFALAGLLAPVLVDAEPSDSTRLGLSSGLHTTRGGNTVLVTVAEVGSRAASSPVQIKVFDAADQLLSSTEGVVARARPVHLELPLATSTARIQFRVVVSITSNLSQGSAPVVTLEDIGPDGFVVEQRVTCAPPIGTPISTYCPEWSAVDLSAR